MVGLHLTRGSFSRAGVVVGVLETPSLNFDHYVLLPSVFNDLGPPVIQMRIELKNTFKTGW